MALAAIPGMTQAMQDFVQVVRLYMRDFAELNRLVSGEESSDRQVAWAVLDALSNFNGTPPITAFSLEDLLQSNQHHLLLRLTVESLVESVALLQTRNHVNYSNGGINVGVSDKTPLLLNWLQYSKAMSEQKKQMVKIALNISSILGPSNSGVHSELWSVNATYAWY